MSRQLSAASRQAGGHPDPQPRVRLPRVVYLFGATSLLNDLASEMIYPLLPAFVTRTLKGGALSLGVLDGMAESVAAGFKLMSGYLADRAAWRGPLVVVGYAVAAVVRPLIAMAGAAWHVVGLRAADRLGKGARTAPRDTMIAEAVPETVRGRAFGLHRAADHVGAIAGPLVAAALLGVGLGVRGVFWIAAIPGLVAVLMAWVAVREAAEGRKPKVPLPDATPPGAPPGSGSGPGLAPLIAVLAVAAGLRAPETLLILRAQDLGVAVAAVPILWAALHVVRSALSYPGGALADRWGPRRTLALGWSVYAALALAYAAAESSVAAWSIFLAFGLVSALTESPERKLVAALAPEGRRGRGFGWYHGSLSVVALPGAVLFGWLYQARGAPWALALSATATLLAAALLATISSSGWARPRSAS